MISVNVSKVLEELKQYHQDTERRLKNMVVGFAYTIAKTAIEKTPIGDAEKYFEWYQSRKYLEPEEGFARGSWQANASGQFSIQTIYGATSGSEALSLVKSDLGSYKLGDTVFVGNKGFYIKALENNYSDQTNNLGIMQPTLDSIMQTYQVDLVRLFREG
ncbi:MAG: hypothetical protein ABFD50_07180 [Smithella sp.]